MQSLVLLCFAALVACACAQVFVPVMYVEEYPQYSMYTRTARHPRDVRDLHWEGDMGYNGKLFGILGSTDSSVFGKAGYKQDFFNDHRGHLSGQAYGSRVITDYGGSSSFGGKVDWANENARAALDVHKEIGGGSGMTLTGDGVWKLDKDTRLVAGGNLEKTFGHSKPEFGLEAKIEHDF